MFRTIKKLKILLRGSSQVRFYGTEPQVSAINWQHQVQDLDPKQVQDYHKEQLIMVDRDDNVLGQISKGESHCIDTVRKNIYHRALSLLIFDEHDRFLLTQRSASKITFPNYFTNACCSHPLYTESELENMIGVRRATIRRSNFELGIKDLEPRELTFVNKMAYRAESDGGKWGEAEIDYIFVVQKNLDLSINREEVQSYLYVTKAEMQDLLLDSSIKVTPWVRLLARDFLFKYWNNLKTLNKIADPERIVRYNELLPAT